MKAPVILLLTREPRVEILFAKALLEKGRGKAVVVVARNIDDALQAVCTRGDELDFAVIDFDDGCHGMTLLSAINMLREELPIMVLISSDTYRAAALAYANGAAACLAKPMTAAELVLSIRELRAPRLELEAGLGACGKC
jgi:DNA-binding NtrC family response regulator